MSRIEKLIERIRSIPTPNDITLGELKRLAKHYGLEFKIGTKHKCFVHESTGKKIPFPNHDKHIQSAYINQLITFIDENGLSE